MVVKKYFFLACFLLIVPISQSLASDNDTLNNIQDKIKNDAPKEINNFWTNTGAPFVKNIYGIADSWLAKNMPAAREEFVSESQSMPKELWSAVVDTWHWIAGPKK
jgi:hypothetical protein